MKQSQRFLVAVTLLNVALTLTSLSQLPQARAAPNDPAPVLRGRALEIVDDRGRVRASIQVHPANAKEEETVVLRLVNAEGGPGVKIASAPTEAGLAFIAGQGNYIQVSTDGVKLTRQSKLQAAWP